MPYCINDDNSLSTSGNLAVCQQMMQFDEPKYLQVSERKILQIS